ncbi:MAG: triose-phosphate isomerase [Candidatus Omnitrophica bacterium]|nr:triose-phosphate isomerase [Candidatus Omnitrophota bacterium]
MRKIIIAGNWKMYKTISEALELVNGLKRILYNIENVEIVICPPYTCLDQISELISESNIKLGAQDMHWETEGAFTGEVSVLMLKDLSCRYVIIGHSERRQYFSETNETVNKKVKTALKYNITPIVCVGEKLEERQAGKTFQIIEDHIKNGLKDLSKEELARVVIAYEPVWAIGTGLTAKPEQAQEVHSFIRKLLSDMSDEETAQNITIQYGGSVKPDNTKDLIKQKDIDGALVGGASLKIDPFVEIIKNAAGLEAK